MMGTYSHTHTARDKVSTATPMNSLKDWWFLFLFFPLFYKKDYYFHNQRKNKTSTHEKTLEAADGCNQFTLKAAASIAAFKGHYFFLRKCLPGLQPRTHLDRRKSGWGSSIPPLTSGTWYSPSGIWGKISRKRNRGGRLRLSTLCTTVSHRRAGWSNCFLHWKKLGEEAHPSLPVPRLTFHLSGQRHLDHNKLTHLGIM